MNSKIALISAIFIFPHMAGADKIDSLQELRSQLSALASECKNDTSGAHPASFCDSVYSSLNSIVSELILLSSPPAPEDTSRVIYTRNFGHTKKQRERSAGIADGPGLPPAFFEFALGLSIPTGEGAEHLNNGFSICAAPYLKLNSNAALGLSLQYDRWRMEAKKLPDEFKPAAGSQPVNYYFSVDGSTRYFIVSPCFRLQTNRPRGNAFIRMGIAYYIGSSELELTVNEVTQDRDSSFADGGFSVSGGVLIPGLSPRHSFLIGFTYNGIIGGDGSRGFFDIQAGFVF